MWENKTITQAAKTPPTKTKKKAKPFLLSPLGKTMAVLLLLGITVGTVGFTYYYVKYARLIDQKLKAGPFADTSKIFAASKVISVGDKLSPAELVDLLRRSGYGESSSNRTGWYHLRPDTVEIIPGVDAVQPESGVIKFAGGKVSAIVSTSDRTARTQFQLEPELITNLSDRNREKRRIVHFNDIPANLVHAIISAEDKRFFQHSGFDPYRVIKAVYDDLREGRKKEGASTLSMQLAREFWLDQRKNWGRKAAEVMITLELEQKLSKNEIFEYYANQISLGQRGSFSIHGFGQAAQAYFGKDIRQLNTHEAATLAGIIQRPSYFNPYRRPEQTRDRRNLILSLMRQNGYITDREYAIESEAPLGVVAGGLESTDAPYFVDLVNDELSRTFQDRDFQASAYRIYTTLDMNLQRAAAEAVRIGMQNVDDQLKKQRRHKNVTFPDAQVALIAIDPRTAEVKALVGGRNYGVSQLNHILSKRQPGSIFKPFVYATAMNTGITPGAPMVLTPATKILDEPTTFWFDDKPYEPGNFTRKFLGEITLRDALAHSINIPAVKVAEMVGYDNVVDLARNAGMNLNIHPTPSVALGAYEVTPVEMAGAYTVFANEGSYVKPNWISMVRARNNTTIYRYKPETHRVLDPRVAYMMVNLLEEVTRSGTAAGIRSRGFRVPAAGKTGTSGGERDGWFAGFTSELICVVWVGFDDNRELGLEGSKSALPIWTEFMKRALEYKEYRNAKPFDAPEGIITVEIDPLSGQPATNNCPTRRMDVFIAGTQPLDSCRLHGGGQPGVTRVAGWETQPPQPSASALPSSLPPAPMAAAAGRPRVAPGETPPPAPASAQQEEEPKKKKGFFGRIFGVFK
ncbi:MAG TPA: PBP1A family penicillin-binding protein [Bryobacteraceae bacterium]|nr:PBP1A family penicillin-binding protein [Bryobacteraceae bacterium]